MLNAVLNREQVKPFWGTVAFVSLLYFALAIPLGLGEYFNQHRYFSGAVGVVAICSYMLSFTFAKISISLGVQFNKTVFRHTYYFFIVAMALSYFALGESLRIGVPILSDSFPSVIVFAAFIGFFAMGILNSTEKFLDWKYYVEHKKFSASRAVVLDKFMQVH